MSFAWRFVVLVLIVSALTAGCTAQPERLLSPRLASGAPAAAGFPARLPPNEPSPLKERPPFGLYAQPPSDDTLTVLASGALSPDGRFRAAMTPQGAWVARIDGAWLWQITLPASAVPVGPLRWTERDTLLFQDSAGKWLEANPSFATVTAYSDLFKGAAELTPSPDGSQVLYYVAAKAGRQLWRAKANGTDATLLGLNITGRWDAQKREPIIAPITAPRATPRNRALDRSLITR